MSDETRADQPVVLVAKPECLRCTHLAGELGTKEFDCLGDRICPANFYRIAQGVPVHDYAKRLAAAMGKGSAADSADIMAELADLDPAVSARVMEISSGIMREQD